MINIRYGFTTWSEDGFRWLRLFNEYHEPAGTLYQCIMHIYKNKRYFEILDYDGVATIGYICPSLGLRWLGSAVSVKQKISRSLKNK